MATPNALDATLVIASLGQTFTGYAFFLPPLSVVRKSAPSDPAIRGDVRMGEIAGASLAILSAYLLSSITGSRAPLFAVILSVLVIVGVYEFALRAVGSQPA